MCVSWPPQIILVVYVASAYFVLTKHEVSANKCAQKRKSPKDFRRHGFRAPAVQRMHVDCITVSEKALRIPALIVSTIC